MTNSEAAQSYDAALGDSKSSYNRFLLLVAGLGGLLYGVDVGIIGGALPYLEATSHLNAGQLSIIVAAVLLGSVISTLFAGQLADWMGRKPLMILSGLAFVISIPVIALSHGYAPFSWTVVSGDQRRTDWPGGAAYLAECLKASTRGKGTGVFQWLLTLGIVAAALIGIYFSYRVAAVGRSLGDRCQLYFLQEHWPGARFLGIDAAWDFCLFLGSFFLAESPRWLFKRGKTELAYAALLRLAAPRTSRI